jgi:acyl-[acyl carrier protein]--UDP-N-acetylglucosamine O-acyltransferase
VSHNAVFAGHTRVHEGVTVGMAAITHQHSTIGAYAMLGMGAVVTRDVPPFALVTGNPARFRRLNTHALERLEIGAEALRVEGGELRSEDERVAGHLAAFSADRREARHVVALI